MSSNRQKRLYEASLAHRHHGVLVNFIAPNTCDDPRSTAFADADEHHVMTVSHDRDLLLKSPSEWSVKVVRNIVPKSPPQVGMMVKDQKNLSHVSASFRAIDQDQF